MISLVLKIHIRFKWRSKKVFLRVQNILFLEDDKAAEVLLGSPLDLKLVSSKNLDIILLAAKKGRMDILKILHETHGEDFIEQLSFDFNQAIAFATANSRTDIISFIHELSKKENENNPSEKKKKGLLSLFAKK